MIFKASLSRKVLLIVGSLIVLSLAAILYISNAIILTSFARLEEQKVYTNVERVQKSVEGELDNLATTCGDWAPWDGSRDFILGKDPNFPTSDLTVDCLANLKLNFMIFVDPSGKIFHITAIDIKKNTFSQVSPALIDHILANKSLLNIKNPAQIKTGLIILRGETVLVAAQPISNSLTEGPISGTLIMGRYLNDNMLKALGEQTRLNIIMTSSEDTAKTSDSEYAGDELSKDNNIIVWLLNKNTLAGYTNIYGLDGNKYITLRINMPREIYNQGRQAIRYFMTAMTLTATVILVILLFLMNKVVLEPINALTKNFIDIRRNHGTSTKLYTKRDDEIGSLARSFDEMMETLKTKMSDLDESQNLVRSIIDTDPAVIFVKDCDGRYLLANKAMAELYGTTCKEMLGKTDMDFVDSAASSPEHINKFISDDTRVIQSQKPLFIREEQFASSRGWTTWFQTYKVPITVKGGLKCVLGIGIDITQRKKNEDATNSLNRELMAATEKVETANIELRNFIYVASHYLREPLHKIAAFSDTLYKSFANKLTGSDDENLHRMAENANRMTKIVEGLLAYSRVDMEALPFKNVDTNETIEQLKQSELAALLEEKNAIIEIPQPLPNVIADPLQFRQLLENLITNGIMYQVKDAIPHITITSKSVADGMTRIEVADNGIGIKPEYYQTLFMVFKRIGSGGKYENTGLGLAVCKKIIERHGGKIGVISKPGKGSTFWFTIPASSAAVFAAHSLI